MVHRPARKSRGRAPRPDLTTGRSTSTAAARPPSRCDRYVAHYTGYRQRGVPPARHRGLPVVYGDGDVVHHAQLSWPEGGGIMLGSARPGQEGQASATDPGAFGAHVVTAEPDALCARARAAGAEITAEPHDTDYGSRDFAARDPEGNRWSFGTYRGEPRKG